MLDYQVKKFNSQRLLEIIVFYDLFDFPLTLMEIRKEMPNLLLSEIKNLLNEMIMLNKIQQKDGFYFLKQRQEIIEIRLARYNYSLRKIKIAKRFANIFSLLPSVLAVYVVNSIGSYNLRNGSDIDFLIITKKNRIWLSRFFCAGISKLLNQRPNKKTKKDKLCLSFYLSEDKLDLSSLKMPGGDPYFDFWERNMLLLKDKAGIHWKFLKLNRLTDFYSQSSTDDYLNLEKDKECVFLNFLEKLSYKLQFKIMPESLKTAALESQGVIIGPEIIKLYLRDRRLYIKEKYDAKIARLA